MYQPNNSYEYCLKELKILLFLILFFLMHDFSSDYYDEILQPSMLIKRYIWVLKFIFNGI